MLLRCISIHAPLAGRDGILREGGLTFEISIHAPLAGRDYAESRLYDKDGAFQSTRPSRGATTIPLSHYKTEAVFQSTRPSRGATMARDTATLQ